MNRVAAQKSFENMMALADFGAARHEERRQLVFRVFVSYMTLLVVLLTLLMNNWSKLPIERVYAALAVLVLGVLAAVYHQWLVVVYRGLIADIRRRDFFLKKAEVLCHRISLNGHFNLSEMAPVYLNLGSGENRMLSEAELFRQGEPDIGQYFDTRELPGDKISVCCDRYFLFNLIAPLVLNVLLGVTLAMSAGILKVHLLLATPFVVLTIIILVMAIQQLCMCLKKQPKRVKNKPDRKKDD